MHLESNKHIKISNNNLNVIESANEYYAKNKKKMNTISNQYYYNNKEKIKLYYLKKKEENKDKYKCQYCNYATHNKSYFNIHLKSNKHIKNSNTN